MGTLSLGNKHSMISSPLKKLFLFLSIVLILAGFFVCFPSRVAADGGAPNLAYVAGTAQGISIIDIAQQKATASIKLSGDPHTILLSLDGRLLYVTQPRLSRVTVIATATKQTVCTVALPGAPSLLAQDPDTHVLYAAGHDTAVVNALDPTTCAIKYTIHTKYTVKGLALAVASAPIEGSKKNQLWVADTASLNVFDAAGRQLAAIPIADGPEYLSIPPGPTAYFTTRRGTVAAIDLSTRHLYPPLLKDSTFGPMDYDETTGKIYVPDMQHHKLNVLLPINKGTTILPGGPNYTYHLDSVPQSVAITSDGQFGFVALENGNILALDIPARQISATTYVGGRPHFIITGLYPSLINLPPQQIALVSWLADIVHYVGVAVIIILTAVILWRERARLGKR